MRSDTVLPPFTHAFQPIVDVSNQSIFAYEALLRGVDNSAPGLLFRNLDSHGVQSLDRQSRLGALSLAGRLSMASHISLNALPLSFGDEENSAHALVAAASAAAFPLTRVIIEVTENELIADADRFAELAGEYRRLGFQLAIDDFGAGHSGLNLLADFQPDIIKFDMNLVRNIDSRGPRQSIVRAIMQVCFDLGIDVIAEGVETVAEYRWFKAQGVQLFQGFLFARPGFESLPTVVFPV